MLANWHKKLVLSMVNLTSIEDKLENSIYLTIKLSKRTLTISIIRF